MKTLIKRLYYKNSQLELILGDEDKRYIELDGVQYTSLEEFLSSFPSLLKANELTTLALISNFFFGGLNYTFIEDIKGYQENYLRRIKKEINDPSNDFKLSQYGEFDVSNMVSPQLKENTLSYFVESVNFSIPYHVKCTFSESDCQCTYSLLSQKRV